MPLVSRALVGLTLLACGVQPFGGVAFRAPPRAPLAGRTAHSAARAPLLPPTGPHSARARAALPRCATAMGIPKFFGWLCERYPLLKEHIRDGPAVIEREFDAFYLDMNGIIHTCTHGDDLAFGEQLDEEQMFRRILQYTDRLVSLVRPQKILYLAIDGVAPRAKLNQQRSRRFRAALEKNADRDKLIEMGQLASGETIFDSNCITPGTAFLSRLGDVFRRWIAYKVENDPQWAQGARVVFSGADCPGEGEHKIMEYIRMRQRAPDYEAGMRHCFYGLDADLIMLGLVTHEPEVSLLRERPRFNRGQAQRSLWNGDRLRMTADDFLCLDLSVLRRSLALPKSVHAQLDFEADERRLIDDFVLICMLVGNDFLPGLPHLDVAEGALNMMLHVYYRMLPQFGGYLTNGSELHLGRFEAYLREICVYEEPHFKVRARKEPWMDELPDYRHAYYRTKFGITLEDARARTQAVDNYMHGVQWCLRYYHDGCCSWTWFYPDFYAPLVSDLVRLERLDLTFDMGKPLAPLVQLLAVLPPESKQLLPLPYRLLMTETESAVIDGYPMHFEVDRNGKQREWEATSLIPFLDEETLQASAKAIDNGLLSPTEAKRNSHGIETVFTPLGVAPADVPGPKAQSPTPRPRTAKPRVVKGMQA
ncbi:hypothetical protein KFE25_006889 [Diacronema lutheri]|uniref:Uncharacterized protein n=2 Tax=Diacronema lutheri TaxID=2081491 RepID=A0A8J5XSY9_DIALT|nr:hypothetical protein KFE25_006889 [Diacronema lutheri]